MIRVGYIIETTHPGVGAIPVEVLEFQIVAADNRVALTYLYAGNVHVKPYENAAHITVMACNPEIL